MVPSLEVRVGERGSTPLNSGWGRGGRHLPFEKALPHLWGPLSLDTGIMVQRAGGALEAAGSFTRASRSRFANGSHQLNPRLCWDETQKVCPGGGVDLTGSEAETGEGRLLKLGSLPFPSALAGRVPGSCCGVGWGMSGKCTGLDQELGRSDAAAG